MCGQKHNRGKLALELLLFCQKPPCISPIKVTFFFFFSRTPKSPIPRNISRSIAREVALDKSLRGIEEIVVNMSDCTKIAKDLALPDIFRPIGVDAARKWLCYLNVH